MQDILSVPRYMVRTKQGDQGPLTARQVADWAKRGLPLQANILDQQTGGLVSVASVVEPLQAAQTESAPAPVAAPAARARPGGSRRQAALSRARPAPSRRVRGPAPAEEAEEPDEAPAERRRRFPARERRRGERKDRGEPQEKKDRSWLKLGLGCLGTVVLLIAIGGTLAFVEDRQKSRQAAAYKQEAAKVLVEELQPLGYEKEWIEFLIEKHHKDCLSASYKSGGKYKGLARYDEEDYAKTMGFFFSRDLDNLESEAAKEFAAKFGRLPKIPGP